MTDTLGDVARPWCVYLLISVATTCYAHQGNADRVVTVKRLHQLLRKTEFFRDDVAGRKHNDRITLLEHTMQVVCNVSTLVAQDALSRLRGYRD